MSGARRFCFPRDNRITTADGYASTKKRGTRIMTRHLILYVARSRTGRSRLGIVASRKVGNAVIRNRHKRLLREVFRLHQGTFQAPVDIMAIVKRDASPPAYRDYERDLLYGISKYFGRPRSAG